MSDPATWIQHEAGWYTLRGVGGICRERDGWAFWPLRGKPIRGLKSMDEAKRVALGVDISDYGDEWCAGFLCGQVNALNEVGYLELVREVERLRRVEEAAKWVRVDASQGSPSLNQWGNGNVVFVNPHAWFALADALDAALANPAAEEET